MWERDAVLLPRTYIDIVLAAGGVPVLLPPTANAARAVDRVDAVLLSGGRDVAPDRYGAAPHPETGLPHPERDTAELVVLDRALELDLPVLGVCRGAQLLNVALGGTLHQHLPDVVGHDGHNPTPGVFTDVDVRLDPTGRVGPSSGRTCGCAATTTRPSTGSHRAWSRPAGPRTARSRRWSWPGTTRRARSSSGSSGTRRRTWPTSGWSRPWSPPPASAEFET